MGFFCRPSNREPSEANVPDVMSPESPDEPTKTPSEVDPSPPGSSPGLETQESVPQDETKPPLPSDSAPKDKAEPPQPPLLGASEFPKQLVAELAESRKKLEEISTPQSGTRLKEIVTRVAVAAASVLGKDTPQPGGSDSGPAEPPPEAPMETLSSKSESEMAPQGGAEPPQPPRPSKGEVVPRESASDSDKTEQK